jgi:hypothetical protein
MDETEYDCINLTPEYIKSVELLVHCNLCFLKLRMVKADCKLGEYFITSDCAGNDCVESIHHGNKSVYFIIILLHY